MKSERLFLLMLFAILGLLVASTVLGFLFFRHAATKPTPRAASRAARPGPGRPAAQQPTDELDRDLVNRISASRLMLGLSGREQKYDLKVPIYPPSDGYPFPAAEGIEKAVARPDMYTELPLVFEDTCEEYGGRYDFEAAGADFEIYLGPGEVCLNMHRRRIDIDKDDDITFTPRDVEIDPCDLDQQETICMKMLGVDVAAGASLTDSEVGTIRTTDRPAAETFRRWHTDLAISAAAGTTNAARAGQHAPLYNELMLETPAARRNVFLGDDPRGWITGAPSFPTVHYTDIYPGIDMACYGAPSRFEYVFVVWPGADPSTIEMTFEGANQVFLDSWGNLVILFRCGKIVQRRPRLYQVIDGVPRPVEGGYELRDRTVSFNVRAYDADEPLYASPAMDLLSFLGGEDGERAYATVVDDAGYAYVAGETTSPQFAVAPSGERPRTNNIDVFVCKYRISDSQPVYTTFLGGRGEDRALDVATDANGNVYLCGETLSDDFPATNSLAGPPPPGSWDAFVVKLNADGVITDFSSRLGGSGDDRAYGLALDAATNVYVAGETWSDDFPKRNAISTPLAENTREAFLAKLDITSATTVYVATLGGNGHDGAYAVAVDLDGAATIVGETSSRDFPLKTPYQAFHGGGFYDGFLARLAPDGDALRYCTFLGGTNDDRCYGLSVDAAGNTYVAGETASSDFPVRNALQPAYGGGDWDGFAAKFTPAAAAPLFCTYVGGSGIDRAFGSAADGAGSIHVVGTTSSTNLTLLHAAQELHGGGQWDGFAAKLAPGGARYVYSTYVGGPGEDALYAVNVDPRRNAHVAGFTTSTNLPVVNAMQSEFAGGKDDAMVAKLLPEYYPGPELRLVPAGGQPGGPDYDYYVSRFEATNHEFARFLNDAQANTNNARGTNMFFDARGNVWLNPEMEPERDEMFTVADSRILYQPTHPLGTRYHVSPRIPREGGSYSNHPIVGVSWYGAVKYCNWLTLETGRGVSERCYREGTNTWDWAPVTSAYTNWVNGNFTQVERDAWLEKKGYRLPMDNCDLPRHWLDPLFMVPNKDFARFLNDLQSCADLDKIEHVYFDAIGNVWFNPARQEQHLLFSIFDSRLNYDLSRTPGHRYEVSPHRPPRGASYSNYPVQNVTWHGAMKYCNWLTLDSGLAPDQRCYTEGTNRVDWRPVTCPPEDWQTGDFTDAQRDAWLNLDGYHLALNTCSPTGSWVQADLAVFMPTGSWANAFNEFYKAAAWTGSTNVPYAFGRDTMGPRDANYLDSGAFAKHDTSRVGYYNGRSPIGEAQTHTNANQYGIYDMSGNVTEWLTDPGRIGSLDDRACYGGSWLFALPRLEQRFFVHPYFTDHFRGFRVVTTYSDPTMFLVRIPYYFCLCGYGTGKGCEEREAEGPKLPRAEAREGNVLLVTEEEGREGLLYKDVEEEEEEEPEGPPDEEPPIETIGDD